MIELAERLGALSGIPDAKVFFATSGSEANEAALLLASTVRRSNQVLALRNSYHGRSFATMGVTGNPSAERNPVIARLTRSSGPPACPPTALRSGKSAATVAPSNNAFKKVRKTSTGKRNPATR
jgi:4-aminobutyrate aminotransferase-like enzyme